jgi:hypothetical protein
MIERRCLIATLLLSLVCTVARAQDQGAWRAASKTAENVTGDIALGSERISIDFFAFPIASIRAVSPTEVKAVFNLDATPATPGVLYKLNIPATRKFLRRNNLCGTEDVQWMVTYGAGKELQVAFFSGNKMPGLDPETMMTTTALCGTYTYVR